MIDERSFDYQFNQIIFFGQFIDHFADEAFLANLSCPLISSINTNARGNRLSKARRVANRLSCPKRPAMDRQRLCEFCDVAPDLPGRQVRMRSSLFHRHHDGGHWCLIQQMG